MSAQKSLTLSEIMKKEKVSFQEAVKIQEETRLKQEALKAACTLAEMRKDRSPLAKMKKRAEEAETELSIMKGLETNRVKELQTRITHLHDELDQLKPTSFISSFSTGIYIKNLKQPKLNTDLKTLALDTLTQGTRHVSNRGGIQTINVKLTHPIAKDFIQATASSIFEYINHYQPVQPYHFAITDLWFNFNRTGAYNVQHSHGAAGIDFSGSYYIQALPDSGDMVLINPDSGMNYSGLIQDAQFKKFNPFNSTVFKITPEPTRLVLFPAHLEHRVEPNRNQSDRISLAFNLKIIR